MLYYISIVTIAAFIVMLSNMSLVNLHALFLQDAMAQVPSGGPSSSKLTGNDSQNIQCITTPCKYPTSQAMPPEPEIDCGFITLYVVSKFDIFHHREIPKAQHC
jgi:hypothetical protein